jgi:hypothetical protein
VANPPDMSRDSHDRPSISGSEFTLRSPAPGGRCRPPP